MKLERPRDGKEHPPAGPSQADPAADFVLEVLDASTGEAIATRVFETGTFGGFIDKQRLWTIRELDDGQIVLDVWRFALRTAN